MDTKRPTSTPDEYYKEALEYLKFPQLIQRYDSENVLKYIIPTMDQNMISKINKAVQIREYFENNPDMNSNPTTTHEKTQYLIDKYREYLKILVKYFAKQQGYQLRKIGDHEYKFKPLKPVLFHHSIVNRSRNTLENIIQNDITNSPTNNNINVSRSKSRPYSKSERYRYDPQYYEQPKSKKQNYDRHISSHNTSHDKPDRHTSSPRNRSHDRPDRHTSSPRNRSRDKPDRHTSSPRDRSHDKPDRHTSSPRNRSRDRSDRYTSSPRNRSRDRSDRHTSRHNSKSRDKSDRHTSSSYDRSRDRSDRYTSRHNSQSRDESDRHTSSYDRSRDRSDRYTSSPRNRSRDKSDRHTSRHNSQSRDKSDRHTSRHNSQSRDRPRKIEKEQQQKEQEEQEQQEENTNYTSRPRDKQSIKHSNIRLKRNERPPERIVKRSLQKSHHPNHVTLPLPTLETRHNVTLPLNIETQPIEHHTLQSDSLPTNITMEFNPTLSSSSEGLPVATEKVSSVATEKITPATLPSEGLPIATEKISPANSDNPNSSEKNVPKTSFTKDSSASPDLTLDRDYSKSFSSAKVLIDHELMKHDSSSRPSKLSEPVLSEDERSISPVSIGSEDSDFLIPDLDEKPLPVPLSANHVLEEQTNPALEDQPNQPSLAEDLLDSSSFF